MKLLDKIKNTFFEEEYIEVEEEKPKAVAKKVEVKEIKRESVNKQPDVNEVKKEHIVDEDYEEDFDDLDLEDEEVSEEVVHYSDSELSKKDSKLPYFEDEDFIDTTVKTIEEPKKIYGESIDKLYDPIKYSHSTTNMPYGANKEGFKPTPIISPIYGVLDKNYKKEEVVDKKPTNSYVSRKNVDLDSIRQKAYGITTSYEDTTDNYQEYDNDNEEVVDDDLLYDMTGDNNTPVVDKVTIADAEEYFEDLGLEYNIDYKDDKYEKATGRRTKKAKEKVEEVEETSLKEEIEDNDEANLEDNLFDLIDSMYEEGEE